MKLPGQASPKLFWVVPFLIGFIVGGLVFTAVVVWITSDMPVNPICTGDLEVIDGSCQCQQGYDQIGNECYRQDIGKGVGNLDDECTLDPGAEGCSEAVEVDSAISCEDPLINIDQECVCPNNGWQIERDGQIFCLDVEEPLTEEQGLNP